MPISIGYASTYYVDATAGDDSNNGTSINTPWKTISKVNDATFSAGDNILFKKGETWFEQLTIPSSGSSGHNIVFSSYGVGVKPTINGNNTATYGIYVKNKSYVTIDGFNIKKFRKDIQTYAVYIYGGTYNNVCNCDISEVYYVTNPNIGGDPHAWEQDIGFGVYIENSNNATVHDNLIKDIGQTAIFLTAGSGTTITTFSIFNNEVTNFNAAIRLGLSNANGTITGGKIYNNYIHDFNNYYYCSIWHRNGIHVWAFAGDPSATIENLEIYNNYFEDLINPTSGSTSWIYMEFNCKNFIIHHNVLGDYLGAFGLRISGDDTAKYRGFEIYNNTFFLGTTCLTFNNSTDMKVKNNIFNNINSSFNGGIWVKDLISLTNYKEDYNLFFGGQNEIFRLNDTMYTWNEWISKGYEANGVNASPLFEGKPSEIVNNPSVFKLSDYSPAIDKGTNLGFTSDFEGNIIPQGYAPDIGAFESTPPTPPVINSVLIRPNKGYAKIGSMITIVVTESNNQESLVPSTATINGKQVTLAGQGNGTYTGTYTVEEGDNDGVNVEAANITLTGAGGTSAPTSSTGSALKVDAHKPTVKSVVISPDVGWLKTGSSVIITATAGNNEAGLDPSNAQLNGKSIPLTNQGNGTYKGIYTVQAGDEQGVNIEATGIILTDAAGNASNAGASTGSSLSIDTQVPQIQQVKLETNVGKIVVPGDSIIITIYEKNNESGLLPSNTEIKGKIINVFDQGNGSYKGLYIIQPDDPVGAIEAMNITLTDFAGNTSLPASSSNSEIIIATKKYLTYLKADFNKDNIIDFIDFIKFGDQYGNSKNQQGWNPIFDLIPDGIIDFLDFTIFSDAYGKDLSNYYILKGTFPDYPISNKSSKISVKVDEKSSLYTIEISITDYKSINGYEFIMSYDENSVEFVNNYDELPALYIPIVENNKVRIAAYYDGENFNGKVLLNFRAKNNQKTSFFEITKALVSDETGINKIDLINKETKIFVSLTGNNNTGFELFQNQPNPFNPNTTISFCVFKAGSVKIEIYNIDGQKIKTIVNGYMEAGKYNIEFDASGLSSGIYFCKMGYNNSFDTKKMLLMK
jgi:hypothetical protein